MTDASTPEIATIHRFIEAINSGDVGLLLNLMSEDHVLSDPMGNVVTGADNLRVAWSGYFAMFPDYRVTIAETLQHENMVALFGTASGTYSADGTLAPENHWALPAAWKALVKEGRVVRWAVYADNDPVRRIIDRSGCK